MSIVRKLPTASLVPLFLLALAVGATWLIYTQALPGRFLFDDPANLNPLSEVLDWSSALDFVSSGISGPLGRPLTLASFLPQADAWPDHPEAMLRVNFVIHLAAMLACFVLAAGLARLRLPEGHTAPLWIGLGVAVLWGLSPFLATTHLMVIQRMTSLAGFFVLTGLASFVWAHLLAGSRPRLARGLLVAGLGLGTLLATLAKENGALLPLLAVIVLWLWIPREQRLKNPVDRALVLVLAILASLFVLAYLASLLTQVIEHGYGAHRYFTMEGRLLGQPAIVLDYLHNLLLPRASSVSPFMDWLPTPGGWLDPPLTLIAALIWLGLLSVALWLRRAAPYVLFGLIFFLVGHLIESSFIGLELYFAHRNYVPAVGLYFGFVFAVASVPPTYRRLAIAGLAAYALLFGAVLYQVTDSWRQTQIVAETWWEHNPHSERAAQFLASQALIQGDPTTARRIYDLAVQRNPRLTVLQIRRATLCVGRESEFPELAKQLLALLPTAFYQPFAAEELARIARSTPDQYCSKLDHTILAAMADALLSNPIYAKHASTKSNLLLAKAFASSAANRAEESIAFAMQSYRASEDLDGAFFLTSFMVKFGQDERARAFLEEVRQAAPSHPVKRAVWLQRLETFIATDLARLQRER